MGLKMGEKRPTIISHMFYTVFRVKALNIKAIAAL